MRMRKWNRKMLLIGLLAASVALGGCQKAGASDVAATLNGREIRLGVAQFMARYQQSSYDTYYASYFGDKMWSQDLYGDGTTLEDSVKQSIMESLETMYLLEEHMGEYGVEISQEETDKIKAAAKAFMEKNSKEVQELFLADEEMVAEVLRLHTVQAKMREAIIAGADTAVSDEEAAQRTFSYVKLSGTGNAGDSGSDSTGNSNGSSGDSGSNGAGDSSSAGDSGSNSGESAQGDLQKVKEQAQELVRQVREGADFATFMEAQGHTVSTYSYGKDEDSMDEAVIAMADSLREGEIGEPVETADSVYVLRLDKELDQEATASKKESIITDRQNELYTKVLDEWKAQAQFEVREAVWKKVNFDKKLKIVTPESTESSSGDSQGSGESSNSGESQDSAESSDGNGDSQSNGENGNSGDSRNSTE